MDAVEATYFETPAQFRRWLAKHHASATELWVGFYRKDTGVAGITWPEAVDEALCFGWIDGIRKGFGDGRYANRFTPRRSGSNWSRININRVEELIREGRMQPAGLRAYEGRSAAANAYSIEHSEGAALSSAQEKEFRANREAWKFFQSQPPGYRRIATWWVISAKREETRAKRLATLIADSAAGRRLAMARK